ncbi:hypothetical protein CBLAS_1402 [Campylobacter blaseri]|uniref:Uncharacterized protein n=1 Tax=Campylobacter blaseri TaxID=2042961 RepID=A0A2P8QYD8_9BACT|nr:hypothetical protein [Campylobacter blaseri]PSM51230.1 hypothetical protein CQ405_09175 [Campylobacter blaseri]PSM52112.1 hypothetical protein CRN67_09215 [Campylobacter blaseri]QKF86566.1 hypothetical protein CBLAS_1402 [Campylobacter blaseri]
MPTNDDFNQSLKNELIEKHTDKLTNDIVKSLGDKINEDPEGITSTIRGSIHFLVEQLVNVSSGYSKAEKELEKLALKKFGFYLSIGYAVVDSVLAPAKLYTYNISHDGSSLAEGNNDLYPVIDKRYWALFSKWY